MIKFTEIKKLVKLAKENSVAEFTYGELRVVFVGQTKESALTPTLLPTKESEVQAQQIEKESFVQSSFELDERDLALMSIEDPSRYEQMLIEGELEDDGSGSTTSDDEQRAIDSDLEAEVIQRAKETQY